MKRNAGEASSPAALGKRRDLCNDRYTNGGTGSRARQTLQHCPEEMGPIQALSLAKTSSATKNGGILGREGVNTISIASTEHRDLGTGTRARAAHIHIY
jgi:hypothetical protein